MPGAVRGPNDATVRLTLVSIYVLFVVQAFFFAAFFAVAPELKDLLELTTFEIGVALTGLGVAMALFALPVGFLIDRGGPRRLTLIGTFVLLVAAIGHAVAVDVWSLLGARMLMGLAATIILPGAYTWLRDLVSGERQSMALSAVMPILGVGSAVGPIAGGAITDWISVRAAFWVIAGGLAASFALLLASGPTPQRGTDPPARLRVLLSLLRREPLMLGACVTIVVATIGEAIVNFLIPLQLDDHGVSATTIGVYLGVGAILFVVAGALAATAADRAVRLVVAGAGALTLAVLLVPLIVSDAVPVLVSVLIIRMALVGVLWTIAFPLGGLGATRAGLASGAIFGLLMATIGISSVAGTLAGGALADGPGFASAHAALVATCAVGAVVLLWLARGHAESTAPAGPAYRKL